MAIETQQHANHLAVEAEFPRPICNPFNSVDSPDHHDLWEILIARDADAFAAQDWSICDGDFAADRFDGISARGSLDPTRWSLQYPTVLAYRDDWMRMAKQFRELPLASIGHRELLYRMQQLARIEIADNRAVVLKQFRADESLTGGDRYEIKAQSTYRLHKVRGRWLIVGFIGYLPLEP